jgi:hypothetical protein
MGTQLRGTSCYLGAYASTASESAAASAWSAILE